MDGHELIAFEAVKNQPLPSFRRHNLLMLMAVAGKGLFWLMILAMAYFDFSLHAKIYAIVGVGTAFLVVMFTLAVVWTKPGKRWRTVRIIAMFLLMSAAVVTVGDWLIMHLL